MVEEVLYNVRMGKLFHRSKFAVVDWLDGLPWFVWIPALPFAWAALALLHIALCVSLPFVAIFYALFWIVKFVIRWRRTRRTVEPPSVFDLMEETRAR